MGIYDGLDRVGRAFTEASRRSSRLREDSSEFERRRGDRPHRRLARLMLFRDLAAEFTAPR
jgi:hypothetical protein